MECLKIRGGRPLRGTMRVSGAKNSAVALIPATILASAPCVIENLPRISDVLRWTDIMEELGATVSFEGSTLHVDTSQLTLHEIPNGNVKKMRASYYLMGALLGRFKRCVVGLPGGCDLGPRPIDLHMKGFEALGAKVHVEHGAVHLVADELRGARIYLDIASVGATINIMLAATLAKGQTIIENAAKEPEIIDVATLLNAMGARIKGVGTDVIRIEGVEELHGCVHSIIPDRIVTGTLMIAAAASGGEIILDQVIPAHVDSLIAKLREMGAVVEENGEQIRVVGKDSYQPIDVKTQVYPGFPTDLQQPMTALLLKAEGTSMVTDIIYGSRFKHIDELRLMGANIKVEGRSAIIEGSVPLQSAKVTATDLRAGACLVVAGLMSHGVTQIMGVEHIDRGYENIEGMLQELGADVWREVIE
ncbi:UDP-N-acetylglucosamine 1-carboxyvinyltransferase [Rubeoparvulum massiliense]|uniref:UDP-N-acetylglucosamine 1-carboxyvinyltransferase n=1 Tax=Rubeoparvulum massiliense TaxID=1631346 RepID=UPI00065DF480|nr:UDP-N-acetylglucosamine 1-carboxyvinyltransferase [Rubeoparvulum massiliense]